MGIGTIFRLITHYLKVINRLVKVKGKSLRSPQFWVINHYQIDFRVKVIINRTRYIKGIIVIISSNIRYILV